ncbi:tRNA lysidine(34) synthetase TilS [Flavimaricola marinus]|uniref:tRNA(Ile)-lysidine synthase n=1 Tax=Flavimaricola marinus TaxID=1819565 RepID=A0A238LA98_9RHOB|nr:tRNA lysidine(34) synthetase TilS [Flavimaricola marinus]SMY06609.1 tRNA(Ile)-lysidine synthase [Flavimaricola marinus]
MQLDQGWLLAQAEDAPLLHVVDTAFPRTPPEKIAVAVSGGSDSTALLHLFARWAAQTGHAVQAVTLNHGLRAEAAREAEAVARLCAELAVPHTVLQWDGAAAKGNIQAAAREARYRLIADWAKAQGVGGVALGHTQDDIAETFLIRLSRKAGLDGLAAMRPRFERDGVTWVRPLWQQSRAELRDYLIRNDVTWVDDPSNEDPAYDRTRARAALAALAPLGIDAEGIMHSAFALGQARSALDYYTRSAVEARIEIDRGDVILDLADPHSLPAEIARRLNVAALKWVGGKDYGPRWSTLAPMGYALSTTGKFTLSGCLVSQKGSVRRFTREHQAVAKVTAPLGAVWDGRWIVEGPGDYEVRALGEAVSQCPEWRDSGLPRQSLLASPAVWQGDTLIAAPLAGLNPAFSARIVAEFQDSWDSH